MISLLSIRIMLAKVIKTFTDTEIDKNINNNSTKNKKILFLCEQDWWSGYNNFFLYTLSLKERDQIDCLPFSDLSSAKNQIIKKIKNNGAYDTIILLAHGSGSNHCFSIDPHNKSIDTLRELQDLSQAKNAIVSSCFVGKRGSKTFLNDYVELMKENESVVSINRDSYSDKILLTLVKEIFLENPC